jgi:hypothetical protein
MRLTENIYRALVLLCGPVLWIGAACYILTSLAVHPNDYGLGALVMIFTAMMYLVIGSLSGHVALMVWRRHRWAIILSLVGVLFIELLAMFSIMGLVQAEGTTAIIMIISGLTLCAATLLLVMHVLRHIGRGNVAKRVPLTPYFIVLSMQEAVLGMMILPMGIAQFSRGGVSFEVCAVLVAIMAGFVWMITGVYRKKRAVTVASMVFVPALSLFVVLAYSLAAPAIGIALWACSTALLLTAGKDELRLAASK